MLVSNFSLGFNPPLSVSRSTSKNDVRWTRGYSLQITNLSSQKVEFEIETRITYTYFGGIGAEPLPISLNKMLFGTWHHDANGYYSASSLDIDHNAAQIWHLGPWMWDDRFWTPYVDGYIILRVPVVKSQHDPKELVPQSEHPIPVLLSAWHQDDRIQVVYDTDLQTSSQCDVPLATGKAYNEVVPESQPVFHPISAGDFARIVKDEVKINAMRYQVRRDLDPYRMG